jgi:hypothetical protein
MVPCSKRTISVVKDRSSRGIRCDELTQHIGHVTIEPAELLLGHISEIKERATSGALGKDHRTLIHVDGHAGSRSVIR